MKMTAQILMLALMGVLCGLHGSHQKSWLGDDFNPPFSDKNYSCRCLPEQLDSPLYRSLTTQDIFALHQKTCEFKTYLQSLERHISFFMGILRGDTNDVSAWLTTEGNAARDMGHKLVRDGRFVGEAAITSLYQTSVWLFEKAESLLGLKGDFRSSFIDFMRQFPCEQVIKKTRTYALQSAIQNLCMKNSYTELEAYWSALSGFAYGDAKLFDTVFEHDLKNVECKISFSYIALKDLADFVHALHYYVAYQCTQNSFSEHRKPPAFLEPFMPSSNNILFNILDIYETMSKVPVAQTIVAIERFVKGVTDAYAQLQKQSSMGFAGWLKNQWALISLATGIILVKIIQYFRPQPTGYGFNNNNYNNNYNNINLNSSGNYNDAPPENWQLLQREKGGHREGKAT